MTAILYPQIASTFPQPRPDKILFIRWTDSAKFEQGE